MDVLNEQLLNDEQTAAVLGVAPTTLPAWRHYGRGPDYIKVGKLVRYTPSKIRAWLDKQNVDPAHKTATA
jgi:hypothetical protein